MTGSHAALRRAGVLTIAVLALIGGFALRVNGLGAADLSFDEVATVFVAGRSIPEVIRYVVGAAREHPPFYYLLLSPWMALAGTSEFAVRYPSALFGLLSCALGSVLGRRLLGRRAGWWSLLLFTMAPQSVWAGRNGRMYSLVVLLALATMASWSAWQRRPGWRTWLPFTALSAVGALTHYYLALLWAAQAVLLLVEPRKTRRIRVPWLATLGAIGLGLGLFIALSPGARAMAVEVFGRFPVKQFRAEELQTLVVGLLLGGATPELAWVALVGAGLIAAGWATARRRDRLAGSILAAWSVVPIAVLHLIPEALETRYLMPVLPAMLLSLAALIAWMPAWPIRLAGLAGLALFSAWRLPLTLGEADTTFSTRMEALAIAARPGDALVMNGPWPRLLLSYYPHPETLPVYSVPEAAPPGFDAAVDLPRLEAIARDHGRLWVAYGAIHWADPRYSVSRWLAENTFCVHEIAGMVLCLPEPAPLTETLGPLTLGSRLTLKGAGVDRRSARAGDPVRVRFDLDGQALDRSVSLVVGLVDASGTAWIERETRLGPTHQPGGSVLPDQWAELTGLWLLPGTPPGEYLLGLRVYGDGVDTAASAMHYGWIPVAPLTVLPGTGDPALVGLLPQPMRDGPSASHEALALVGSQPYATHYMEGYLAGVTLWWRAERPSNAEKLEVRLAGREAVAIGTFALGPESYPAPAWQTGDVVRQSVFFDLPDGLPSGSYRAQGHLVTRDGVPVSGTAWHDLFTFTVEARDRHYRAPLAIRRRAATFGGVLELVGYKLGNPTLRAGGVTELTVYWRAMQRPDRLYAVFNHLRGADGASVWQADSWPQAGVYTTNHWLEGEVVAEHYTVRLPEDTAPGTYPLFTGVYDPAIGDRLAALDDGGQRLPNDEVVLVEITVRE